MQNLNTFKTTELNLELFHLQSNTSFDLPLNQPVIRIGKPNDQISPDIDVSNLPDADVASRIHAQIQVTGSIYFIEDLGSSNGTFINNNKLEARTPSLLDLGDRIDLGQGGKLTFIFQSKQARQVNVGSSTNPTALQPPIADNSRLNSVDKTSKILGLALMVAAIVILTANVRVGLFIRLPGVMVCMAGVYILFQRRINHNLGWLLLALGIGVIFFTANVFASVNLLVIISAAALFIAGYQLLSTGKILDYDWRSLLFLVKK
ncbi:FHA domain-containing protein [Cylindrospermum stagnale PCC 7417]|uniref:FHA domain-containing protein n=1 Tax=Cylindrospermum stagnale PCC 7417 TaxID=56107 RepID=K9WRK2_9NOST|nr:FHA domain-containing protein [Cylindrospermum stagnale]AFZ23010.1 FHA domain-containing protein [Cylindrospermum stagnale PCC 7417]